MEVSERSSDDETVLLSHAKSKPQTLALNLPEVWRGTHIDRHLLLSFSLLHSQASNPSTMDFYPLQPSSREPLIRARPSHHDGGVCLRE